MTKQEVSEYTANYIEKMAEKEVNQEQDYKSHANSVRVESDFIRNNDVDQNVDQSVDQDVDQDVDYGQYVDQDVKSHVYSKTTNDFEAIPTQTLIVTLPYFSYYRYLLVVLLLATEGFLIIYPFFSISQLESALNLGIVQQTFGRTTL